MGDFLLSLDDKLDLITKHQIRANSLSYPNEWKFYVFFEVLTEAVPKICIVIPSEAKNLIFFFSNQKSEEEILRLTASG
jgi:hypothetical protein